MLELLVVNLSHDRCHEGHCSSDLELRDARYSMLDQISSCVLLEKWDERRGKDGKKGDKKIAGL